MHKTHKTLSSCLRDPQHAHTLHPASPMRSHTCDQPDNEHVASPCVDLSIESRNRGSTCTLLPPGPHILHYWMHAGGPNSLHNAPPVIVRTAAETTTHHASRVIRSTCAMKC